MMTGLLALAVTAALGCGGVWGEAMVQAVTDQTNELLGELSQVPDGPEKQAVESAILDVQTNAADVGVMEVATFAAEVKMAMEDGQISADEASTITAKKDEILQ